MRRRILFAVILAILGFVGSGLSPAYADARASISGTHGSATGTHSFATGTQLITATHTTSVTPTSPIDTHASTSQKPALKVTITSVGNPTIREGEKLHVQARIANNSDSQLSTNIDLRTTDTFPTRSHLLTFIGSPSATIENPTKSVSIAAYSKPLIISAHSQENITLEVDTSPLGWTAQEWGPRGIEVIATSEQGDSAGERTFVIVEPSTDVQPVPTGIVVPLTDSRAELAELYTADNLTDIRTQPTKRIKSLAETMTMEGVSVISAPAYADLSHASQTVKSAKADADILTLLDLHRTDLAQSLTSETFKDGPAPVRVNSLGSADAFAAYKKLGASAFILDSSYFLTEENNYAAPAAHALLEGNNETFDVLLNDAESAHSILDAPNALQARQNALALSAMTYLEQPSISRPQLLYLDVSANDIWKVNAEGKVVRDYSQLAEASSALMNAPWVQPAHISDLLATPASATVQLPAQSATSETAPDSLLTEQNLTSIDESVNEAAILASLVSDPDSVLDPVNDAVAHLYSQTWQGDEKAYSNALKDFSSLAKEYGNSVSAVSVSTINLVAEQVDVPVRVQNALTVPATVNVVLDSVDARLTVKDTVTVELPPASTTTVAIPVNARGSGNVQAKIRLYNSQGDAIGTPATVKVRVRAGWENTVTAVAAILVTLMLVVGIIRSIKSGRRSKPVAPSDYTKARRKADAAFTAGHTQGIPPHDSP